MDPIQSYREASSTKWNLHGTLLKNLISQLCDPDNEVSAEAQHRAEDKEVFQSNLQYNTI